MASIERRETSRGEPRWRVKWWPNGRSRGQQVRTFSSEHDAVLFRESLETARGDEGEATRRFSAAMKRGETVDDAVTYWIDHISTASAAGKAKMRRDAIRRISPALGWMQLSEVTREDIQRAMTSWSEDVAPKTIRNIMGIVTPALREAAQSGKPGCRQARSAASVKVVHSTLSTAGIVTGCVTHALS